MSGWWKSLPNGLPNVVSPPKSGHRRAAKGMEFPWRCNVDTIAMDLKVSWEMSDCMPGSGQPPPCGIRESSKGDSSEHYGEHQWQAMPPSRKSTKLRPT